MASYRGVGGENGLNPRLSRRREAIGGPILQGGPAISFSQKFNDIKETVTKKVIGLIP